MADRPQSIPDPSFFQNAGRPSLVLHTQKDGKAIGLLVVWLDTCEHQIFGDMGALAEDFWRTAEVKGKNLLSRVEVAEQKVADMERGAMLGYRAELRSRLADETARIGGPSLLYNLGNKEDIERLEHVLGLT